MADRQAPIALGGSVYHYCTIAHSPCGGVKHVLIECFRYPDGLVYLRPFRGGEPHAQDMHLLQGEKTCEGLWKIGDAVVTLPGCHGSNPDKAVEFAEWQFHAGQLGDAWPSRSELEKMARNRGLLP